MLWWYRRIVLIRTVESIIRVYLPKESAPWLNALLNPSNRAHTSTTSYVLTTFQNTQPTFQLPDQRKYHPPKPQIAYQTADQQPSSQISAWTFIKHQHPAVHPRSPLSSSIHPPNHKHPWNSKRKSKSSLCTSIAIPERQPTTSFLPSDPQLPSRNRPHSKPQMGTLSLHQHAPPPFPDHHSLKAGSNTSTLSAFWSWPTIQSIPPQPGQSAKTPIHILQSAFLPKKTQYQAQFEYFHTLDLSIQNPRLKNNPSLKSRTTSTFSTQSPQCQKNIATQFSNSHHDFSHTATIMTLQPTRKVSPWPFHSLARGADRSLVLQQAWELAKAWE